MLNKGEKMKKIQNINLITLSVVIFILICLGATIYYINNLLPKKISIKDNIEIIENSEEIFKIDSIERGKIFSKITIKKKMREDELKKYTNYTLGDGTNYYLNYAIILSNNGRNYKVKSIIEDRNPSDRFDKKDDDGYIYIKCIFLNKNFFKEKYSIGIIQEDYKDEYKNTNRIYYKNLGLIGENNE